MFFKEEGDDDWRGRLTPEGMVRQGRALPRAVRMTVFKLKAGVLDPWEEVQNQAAARTVRPKAGLRIDRMPPGRSRPSIRVAEQLRETQIEYRRNPTAGIEGWRGGAASPPIPLSTTCASRLPAHPVAFRQRAVQVVLATTTVGAG